MPNKTICAIIGIVIIAVTNMVTLGEQTITWASLVGIAALGGVSIWRNGITRP